MTSPAIALLLSSALHAGGVGFQRVDIISEDPGTWLNYDLAMVDVYPTAAALRFLQQVKVVLDLPADGLTLGASLTSQSIHWERPLLGQEFTWGVGVHGTTFLPGGVLAGLAWRQGRLRVGAGIAATSSATWARPEWTHWQVLPTLGLGIGRHMTATGGDGGP